MIHKIKITSDYYIADKNMTKSFEVRKNDRNYQVGDILELREWQNNKYTGQTIRRKITYILNNQNYCKEGFVILGIIPAE